MMYNYYTDKFKFQNYKKPSKAEDIVKITHKIDA